MNNASINAINGMQTNSLWLDRTGSQIANSSVAVQAPESFETFLGNASVTGIDASGTLNPGLNGFSADSLSALNMGMGSEILDLILAQRGFQLNARAFNETSKDLLSSMQL